MCAVLTPPRYLLTLLLIEFGGKMTKYPMQLSTSRCPAVSPRCAFRTRDLDAMAPNYLLHSGQCQLTFCGRHPWLNSSRLVKGPQLVDSICTDWMPRRKPVTYVDTRMRAIVASLFAAFTKLNRQKLIDFIIRYGHFLIYLKCLLCFLVSPRCCAKPSGVDTR